MKSSKYILFGATVAAFATSTFVAGVFVARAKPGGETRRSLSFAGRLSGVTGPQALTFTFKKGGTTQCEPKVTATPDASGAFNVEIPVSGCPGALFDGGDVTFDVLVGTTVVARDQVVNPVPYARYADRVGSPDCPAGYSRDSSIAAFTVCARSGDTVVKVGTGPSAFWIDRYEASVWANGDGGGAQYGASAIADYPATFPPSGQYTTPVFALSRAGVLPSRNLTWFQANEACAASGKRLPTSAEWLRAARATPDPATDSDGSGGLCLTKGTALRKTGEGAACASAWGGEDFIGNAWEWVEEWYAGLGNADVAATPWPTGYGNDSTYNVISKAIVPAAGNVQGAPAALVRGGSYIDGPVAGLHTMLLYYSPAMPYVTIGFRCMVPR